jgi:transposase InsO family protein
MQFHPWDKIYLHIVGPMPVAEGGHKYILTRQDNLSKYLVAVPMFSQTAEEVALNVMRYVILQYGVPCSIVTDQGSQFMGDLFKRLCKLLKINKMNTSAYRPERNGSLERAHKTMIEYLRCFCNPRNVDWDKYLQFACFVYNTTPHTMTKYTPYEVIFGRKANMPGQLQQTPAPVYIYDDLVHDVKRKLQECHEIARTNLKLTKQHRVAQQLLLVNVPKLIEGDKVLLKNEKASKLDPI